MLEQTRDNLKREKNKKDLLNISLEKLEQESISNSHRLSDHVLSLNESFEEYKKEYEKSLNVIIPEIEPIGSRIITSASLSNIMDMKNMLTREDFDLSLFDTLKHSVSDVQIVVAKGPHVKQVEVGDTIKIELKDFTIMQNPGTINRKEVFDLPLEIIDGNKYLSMHENNIKFKYKLKTQE